MSTHELGIEGLESGERIGEGGNAVVYRARQPELDREVAVKILRSTDADTHRRFDRERKAMGRLSQHDGIVTVYDSGYTASGEPYLIMPLLAGSLDDELSSLGQLEWQHAAATMADVCDGVAFAHDGGVVHRDLKPGNIMRSHSGRPLVADFGISRIIDTSTSYQSTAITLTPAFSPPESMNAAPPIPQTDVYSLGATLYALIAGHPPFLPPGEEVPLLALLHRIANEPVPPLAVPEPINALIRTAMAKDPADRFPNAAELGASLRLALNLPWAPPVDLRAEKVPATVVVPPLPHPVEPSATPVPPPPRAPMPMPSPPPPRHTNLPPPAAPQPPHPTPATTPPPPTGPQTTTPPPPRSPPPPRRDQQPPP